MRTERRRGGGARWGGIAALAVGWALGATAEVVHVVERTMTGGTVTVLSDRTVDTGTTYTTANAPEVAGFIFAQWTTDAHQAIADRDAWGRALDAASFTVYENTTLTAEYLPEGEDSDGDGMADGHEIYWYGDLDETSEGDTDGDGYTFAQEIARGSNPLFPDRWAPGPVVWGDSGTVLYNPHQWAPYVVRSEPEGRLFATISEHAEPGTVITTESYDPGTSVFAEWRVNGVRQADAWGRALDAATFTVSATEITEAVAWCVEDEAARQGMYWYGDAGMSADSDTDGDGYTLAQETARGSNPLFPDRWAPGQVVWGDSGLVEYNPSQWVPPKENYVIRSEPEGRLFATITAHAEPGTAITTASYAPGKSVFAEWRVNGVRQADSWGRALDAATFTASATEVTEAVAWCVEEETARQGTYWYGDASVAADSDTDGDGYTLEQEIARGSNPLFPDRWAPGPVVWGDSATVEANLQPFEQLRTALVDGVAVEMFTSLVARNEARAWVFGSDLSPAVADLDGDGLFDLVLASLDGVRVFRNKGTAERPDFVEVADPFAGLGGAFAASEPSFRVIAGGGGGMYLAGRPIRFFAADGRAAVETGLDGVPAWRDGVLYALDPATGAVATTNGAVALDTPVAGGVSLAVAEATQDGRADLLASDGEGRVWLYRGNADGSFTLLHKVWGGTFGGFAEGLKIAAVDWENDGDLDTLGGTAGGRLMMLRNPLFGRPAPDVVVADGNALGELASAFVRSLFVEEEVNRIVVSGGEKNVLLARAFGIEPSVARTGGTIEAAFAAPTIEIIEYDAEMGGIKCRVTPGKGNTIGADLLKGAVRLRGVESLVTLEELPGIAVTVDTGGYLDADTLGEFKVNAVIDFGTTGFFCIVVEEEP